MCTLVLSTLNRSSALSFHGSHISIVASPTTAIRIESSTSTSSSSRLLATVERRRLGHFRFFRRNRQRSKDDDDEKDEGDERTIGGRKQIRVFGETHERRQSILLQKVP